MRYVPDALSYNQHDDQLIHLVLDWHWQPAIFSNPLRHWRGNEGYNVNWNDNAAASLSRILELCGEGLTRSGLDQEHRKVHVTSTPVQNKERYKNPIPISSTAAKRENLIQSHAATRKPRTGPPRPGRSGDPGGNTGRWGSDSGSGLGNDGWMRPETGTRDHGGIRYIHTRIHIAIQAFPPALVTRSWRGSLELLYIKKEHHPPHGALRSRDGVRREKVKYL